MDVGLYIGARLPQCELKVRFEDPCASGFAEMLLVPLAVLRCSSRTQGVATGKSAWLQHIRPLLIRSELRKPSSKLPKLQKTCVPIFLVPYGEVQVLMTLLPDFVARCLEFLVGLTGSLNP